LKNRTVCLSNRKMHAYGTNRALTSLQELKWLAVVPTVPWPWRNRHRWNSRSFPEASPLHSGNGRSR
ncbi:hypothetical protein T02_5182, partial [Trichinella nativa]